jgi:hypothetical protein
VDEPVNPPRKVLIDEGLFQQLGAGRVEWGEPDADGFYTPTVYDSRLHEARFIPCPRCGKTTFRSPYGWDGEHTREERLFRWVFEDNPHLTCDMEDEPEHTDRWTHLDHVLGHQFVEHTRAAGHGPLEDDDGMEGA